MNIKAFFIGSAKVAGLTFGYLICFIIPTMFIPVQQELQKAMAHSGQAGSVMLALLGLSLVAALIISYPIRNAALSGIRLIAAITVTLFGFMTAMGQIETYYFRAAFPLLRTAEILNIVYRGFLTALFFVPLAVITWGKLRGGSFFPSIVPLMPVIRRRSDSTYRAKWRNESVPRQYRAHEGKYSKPGPLLPRPLDGARFQPAAGVAAG